MIKFAAHTDDGIIVGFGLSAENVKRLQDDKPVLIDMAELGLAKEPIARVFIFAGESEEVMAEQLRSAGLVPPGMEPS